MQQVIVTMMSLSMIMRTLQAAPDVQQGGLLLGESSETGWIVSDIYPLERGRVIVGDFVPDHLEIEEKISKLGSKVIGCYHTHPSGSPMPTDQDAAVFKPWRNSSLIWMIIGKLPSGLPYARTFQYHPDQEALLEYLVSITG